MRYGNQKMPWLNTGKHLITTNGKLLWNPGWLNPGRVYDIVLLNQQIPPTGECFQDITFA
jgi:hypothetical protein